MSQLSKDPESSIESLAELVGLAHRIESEAVERYGWLAEEMARRGEDETAAAFRRLAEEEQHHIASVAHWAEGLGQPVPTGSFAWRLPAELAQSWDEAAASALLTPYRALAIAADNEERAFAFYVYIAARAGDPRVAREAEALAQEELNHAALLRTWRRAAWRRERGETGHPTAHRIETSEELAALIAAQKAEIARQHESLAQRLAALGDTASAALLTAPAGPPGGKPGAITGDSGDTAQALLIAAQRPLERLSEMLETILVAPPDEVMQTQAQEALAEVVSRIARIGWRLEALERI